MTYLFLLIISWLIIFTLIFFASTMIYLIKIKKAKTISVAIILTIILISLAIFLFLTATIPLINAESKGLNLHSKKKYTIAQLYEKNKKNITITDTKLKNKQVYIVTSYGCSRCEKIHDVINKYINNYDIKVVTSDTIFKSHKHIDNTITTPAIVYIDGDKIYAKDLYDLNIKNYFNEDIIKQYIHKYNIYKQQNIK